MTQYNGLYKFRRVLSVVLALAVLILALPAFSLPAAADVTFEGEGTADDPYKISTAEQMWAIAGDTNLWDKHFRLTKDIEDLCSGDSQQWTPIGNNTTGFTGTFDGNGHEIKGLYINSTKSTSTNQGLFGVNRGTIEKLTVSGSVTAYSYVGGIAGSNYGTMESCTNNVTVTGTKKDGHGGVVGYNQGKILDCHNIGKVTGVSSVGGIAGLSYSSVKNCYNIGEVSGTSSRIGGIVGESWSTVECCYNIGNVTSTSIYIGGIVGVNRSQVKNCYNTGTVNGSSTVGGVVGYNTGSGSKAQNCYNIGVVSKNNSNVVGDLGSGTITNCFYLSDTDNGVTGETAITAEQFANKDTFTDWDFENIWFMSLDDLDIKPAPRPILQPIPEGYNPECEHENTVWKDNKDEKTHKQECVDCGEILVEKQDHVWGEGAITTEPTETTAGEKTFTCDVCDATKTEPIPATGDGGNNGDNTGGSNNGGGNNGGGTTGGGNNGGSGNNTDTPATGDSDPSDSTSEPTDSEPSTGDSEPSDNDTGNVNIGSASSENAPEVTISEEETDKLKEEIIAEHLTAEEKAAIENGDTLDIILQVEDAGDSTPAEDKQVTEAVLTDTEYTVGMYLNVDLIKLINGVEVGRITELNTPIHVTVEIPEELRGANRAFAIVRVHDGEAEILEDVDDDPDTITILTDKFSTYSIAYRDTEPSNPDTGLPVTVLGLAVAVSAAAVTFRRKKIGE